MKLRRVIDGVLRQNGLPASDFMAQALYHPERGYYRRPVGPWGFEGKDYYTALDLGPLLGETLALRLEKAWERLGRPGVFTVLEPGAGRGWLGRDLLVAARGDFAEALVYLHRDDNPAARSLAEKALEPWVAQGKVRFLAEAENPPALVGAILSNELFDALPAQPWRWTGEIWEREVLTEDGPGWEAADPGEAGQWFAAQAEDGLQPGDGSVWCEGLPKLVKDLCGSLQAGLFLAIDYGESASRLLSKGADLRRYKGHAVDGRWWEEPGEADLTADVDFTRLESLVRGSGLTITGHISLSRWIREHAPLAAWEEAWLSLDSVARIKRMENLLQLTLPTMMGERFRVLEAWREP